MKGTFQTLFLVALALCSNASNAQEPSVSKESILKALSAPASSQDSGAVTKSLIAPAVEQIEVMAEDKSSSKGTRFVVVERQAEAPRIDISLEFDTNSAVLRPTSRNQLLVLADALQDTSLTSQSFAINGHTDNIGAASYNIDLSYRRAFSVRDFLVKNAGLPENRFEVLGFGEAVPLNNNEDSNQRQVNRRVELERLQ